MATDRSVQPVHPVALLYFDDEFTFVPGPRRGFVEVNREGTELVDPGKRRRRRRSEAEEAFETWVAFASKFRALCRALGSDAIAHTCKCGPVERYSVRALLGNQPRDGVL